MPRIKDGFKGSRMIVLPAQTAAELAAGPVTSLLHVTDIGYYPEAEHHFRQRAEGAPQYILICCSAGRGWIECEGRTHALKAGEFFVIPKGRAHSYGADESDPWSIYWLHFAGTLAGRMAEGLDQVCSLAGGAGFSSRIEIFEELFRSLELGCGQSRLEYATCTLFHLLGSFRHAGAFSGQGASGSAESELVARCTRFIRENIERDIHPSDICGFLGVSPTWCTTLLKRHTGMPPGKYIQHVRIQTAAHLFELTGMKVAQVCHKVGISDPYYFSRLFTRTLGITPSQDRKQVCTNK